MIQSANSDYEQPSTPSNNVEDESKDKSNDSSQNGSVEFLPGTSSRPLVLVNIINNLYLYY